jgi:hypothetical protein
VKFPFHRFLGGKFGQIEFDGTDSVGFENTTFSHPLLRAFTLFVMDPSINEFIQNDTTRQTGVHQSLQIAAFI